MSLREMDLWSRVVEISVQRKYAKVLWKKHKLALFGTGAQHPFKENQWERK